MSEIAPRARPAAAAWVALPATLLAALAVVGSAWAPMTVGLLYVAAVTPDLVHTDLASHRLPNRLVLPGYPVVTIALTLGWAFDGRDPVLPLLAGGGYLAFLLALSVTGGLGAGDVKLAGVLGLCLGSLGAAPALLGPVLAFVAGGVAAAVAMIRHGTRTTRIAFGPSMLLGFWAAVLFSALG